MNENDIKILTEYQEADFNHRLNMYLQFRQLRSKFIQIDRNELNTKIPTGFNLHKTPVTIRRNDRFRSLTLNFKRILGTGWV